MDSDNLSQSVKTAPLQQDTLKINVDPEPGILRLILFVVLIVAFIVGYVLATLLFSLNACSLLGVIGGLVLGAISIQIAERLLKPRIKSNRFVDLDFGAFSIIDGQQQNQVIDPVNEFEVTLWWFEVTRRTRVPKGWRVVGLALEQDDQYLPVYTLVSPEGFNALPGSEHFTQLKRKKDLGEQESLRLGGQQRRIMRAETARNIHGLEMEAEDFKVYFQWLQTNFSEWMPKK